MEADKKYNDIDVVVLCGGKGKRLQSVISDRPKPMAQIDQKPFLDMLIEYFCDFGCRRFILCTGHMSEIISQHYRKNRDALDFVISKEHSPLGTAGAVKNSERHLTSQTFLVTNGDSFCPVDLDEFLSFHRSREALVSMAVIDAENTGDTGMITMDQNRRITGFAEKSDDRTRGYINTGIYLFERRVLSQIDPDTNVSLEYELFPELAGDEFYGFVTEEKLFDIGTPERLDTARKILSKIR